MILLLNKEMGFEPMTSFMLLVPSVPCGDFFENPIKSGMVVQWSIGRPAVAVAAEIPIMTLTVIQ